MPYANNNGVKIYYQVEGSGPPLVWQHRLTDCLDTWYDIGYVKELKDSYRLILVDARAHGESDKPYEADNYRPATVLEYSMTSTHKGKTSRWRGLTRPACPVPGQGAKPE